MSDDLYEAIVEIERERDALRARVAELEDDFAKRQASHCCPTWNDQMEDCDCDERMGGHIARWQEAEAEVARLRKEQAESEHDEQQWNDMLRAESDALAKGTDAWLRQVLGHDWNKLWGPNLEALGRGVDELRAEVARLRESEARMRAALEHLVDMRERDVRELGDVDWDLIEAAFDAGTAPAPSPCVECGSPIAPGNKLLCASCCKEPYCEKPLGHDGACGQANAPDRTARLVAALKGIRAKLESESPEFDDYSPIDDLDAALKEFEP